MSKKDIQFNIKFLVDGKEQIVTASTSVKSLQRAMADTKTTTESLHKSVFNLNQAFSAWNNITTAVSGLNTALSSLASSYQNVEVANTRLKTVMQERMNASYLT